VDSVTENPWRLKDKPFDQKLRSVGRYSEQFLSSSAAAQVMGLTPQTGYRAKRWLGLRSELN
jgi:hypothetical protein